MAFAPDPVAYFRNVCLGEDKDPMNPYQNFSAKRQSCGSKFGQGLVVDLRGNDLASLQAAPVCSMVGLP